MTTKVKTPAEIWKVALRDLKLQMTRAAFDTWLRDSHLVEEENGTLVIGVPNVYARDWLEHRLKKVILRTLKQITREDTAVRFVVHSKHAPDDDLSDAGPLLANLKPKPAPSKNGHAQRPADGLNPRYTFDTFVEGPGNRLAKAVARSVAEGSNKLINPLYINADVGLGKSHLLHAIGNLAKEQGQKVLCVTAETFTNDLVEAIRNHTTAALREKYRSVDLLLIDDVQFIAGKENTQEEFFHTFNALYDLDKRIVLTGSAPPADLTGLDKRLRSRLEGGMVADLKAPALETRIKILQAKARDHKKTVPTPVLEFIARRADRNPRQLEGALTRVLAHVQLTGVPLSVSLAESALGDVTPRKSNLTLDQILLAVARVYRVDVEDLRGRSRARLVSLARQVAMFMAREETDISLPQIGERLGGRSHSTVLYSCNRVTDKLPTDRLLRSQITLVKKALEANQAPATAD